MRNTNPQRIRVTLQRLTVDREKDVADAILQQYKDLQNEGHSAPIFDVLAVFF